jgi:hypothetical protein
MRRTVRKRNYIWITKCKNVIVDNGISIQMEILKFAKTLGTMEKEYK